MTEQGRPHHYLCYVTIRTTAEQIVGFVLIAIVIALMVAAGLQYRMVRRVSQSWYVRFIYRLLFVWGAFYLLKVLFSEILYWEALGWPQPLYPHPKTEQQVDLWFSRKLNRVSEYYFIVDILCVFFLQWIFLLIPYTWVSNVINMFKQLEHVEDPDAKSNKDQLKFEKRICSLLRFYSYLRSFVLLLIIPFAILASKNNKEDLLSKMALVMVLLLILETIVVTAVLVIGRLLTQRNEKLNNLIDKEEMQTMINQYSILIACSLMRLLIDGVFFWYNFMAHNENSIPRCYLPPQNYELSMAMLVAEPIFTHYLPIFIVLRIFKVNKQDYNLTESMLAADQYPQDEDSYIESRDD